MARVSQGQDEAGCSESNSRISTDFLILHPLQNTWCLWYNGNDSSKSREENQMNLTSFNTIEEFWRLYHHIKLPSELKVGQDYGLFKEGITPMPEDDANKRGGRWMITLTETRGRSDLDKYWLDVCLLLIGENFDYGEEICGAVVNFGAEMDTISVWTADSSKQEAVLHIGHEMRELLELRGDQPLGYQVHSDPTHTSPPQNLYTA